MNQQGYKIIVLIHVSQELLSELLLGFKPTLLRWVWVSHPVPNPPCHKNTPGTRQSLTGTYHTISVGFFWFFSERSLSTLALNRCPPWPPTLAGLDPRSMSTLTFTPFPVLGPPWPSMVAWLGSIPIMVRLGPWVWSDVRGLLWASTQKFQAGTGIVQYNQFAFDAGTSDTKCRRICHCGLNTYASAIVWVSCPALNPPYHKNTLVARQTESDQSLPWQPSQPASLSLAGLTLWPKWLERWLVIPSVLSAQVPIPARPLH